MLPTVQSRSANERHRHCRRCDVLWLGGPACWFCGLPDQVRAVRGIYLRDQRGTSTQPVPVAGANL